MMSEPKIEAIVALARAAGEAILQIYRRDFAVMEKEDRSPLTAADLASQQVIVAGLEQLTPGCPVLSAAGATIPFGTRSAWMNYWLVDPLDGTREFIKRNGEFTVNIALIQGGRPVLGVVHAPALGLTYWGRVGQGAFRQRAGAGIEAIQVTRPAARPLRLVGSRSHAGDSLRVLLGRIGAHRLVSMGSSLKLCLVAEGTADFYPRLGPTSEWDTAAAQAVVEAAGGRVTDTGLQDLRYNSKESLLNPYFLVFGDPGVPWTDYL